MKIMKVVYTAECSISDWDGGNSRRYMGEESWSIGQKFNGEFIQGEVSGIDYDQNSEYGGGVSIWVKRGGDFLVCAMTIPIHAVQRIYYGEG